MTGVRTFLHLLLDVCPVPSIDFARANQMRARGKSLACAELHDAAHNMCMEEFSRVARSNEFMELGAQEVHEMLSSDDLLANGEVRICALTESKHLSMGRKGRGLREGLGKREETRVGPYHSLITISFRNHA